ncbi:MAG: MBL fold metallo-hydrolase [Eubacteriales bacterium]
MGSKAEKAMIKRGEKYRGAGVFHPMKTSKLGDYLCCIRQKDVNIWFYHRNDQIIVFDSGYCDDPRLLHNIERLGMKNQDITAVFLTHGDLENAGGICSEEAFAPNATIYAHPAEEPLLRGKGKRLSSGLGKCYSPLTFQGTFEAISHKQVVAFDGIEVQCFHCPGHTKGHTVYLVDRKFLFSGDSLAINGEGGQCYFHEFNDNTKENIQSLARLQEDLVGKEPDMVYSSHNGGCSYDKAFSRFNQVAEGKKKAPFDQKAPVDVFTENE